MMDFARCELPHPLFIVLTLRCLAKAADDYPGLPFPQSAAEVEADFLAYAERGVLALVDEKQLDNPRISFCTPAYELVCGLTQQKDAWFAIRMAPLGLRTHNQLVRGAFRIAPQTWGMVADLPQLNQLPADSAQTGVATILAAWRAASQPMPVESAPASVTSAAELAFLANVDTLIDLACEVELEQAARQEHVQVNAGEPLNGSKARFGLLAPSNFRAGNYLRAGLGSTGGEVDGVVVEVTGSSITLRFYQPVEAQQIRRIEWLAPKISTKQYAIQHAAVRALRNNEALNPRLLPLLVENRFAEYRAPTITQGAGQLNPAQRTMIERALVVPDLLLTLGPPGTGKTHSIREIVARQAALGKKVLVTSKNNKAVDNVLEGLGNVQALRIGREEVVSPQVRPLLIDNLSNAMQTKILGKLQPTQQALAQAESRWPEVQALFARLSELATHWQQAYEASGRERAQLAGWQTAAYTRVERALARQEQRVQALRARLDETARQTDGLRRRVESLRRASQLPLLGGLVMLLADRFAQDWQAASQEYRQIVQDLRKTQDDSQKLWESYRQYATASVQALQFKGAVVQAEAAVESAQAEIARAVDELAHLAAELPGAPAQPATISPSTLAALFGEWQKWHEFQARRQGLLGEWREMLQTRPQALYPTLIRSAEVVGATCIGVATDARFEDLEFDLVIADEAGQIQVMDLLVPLVRARRAVLVGDHLQLPPLVEPEIVEKIRANEPENQELGAWLEKSLFERLIERPETPASHRVMLNIQYRMPKQIADFISAQFYGGNYLSGREGPHTDAFFSGSPLVFVDTMKEVRHFEQRAEDGQGYSNPTEARLISDLVLAYQAKGVDAGVIVPYKKQAETIRRELRRRQPALDDDMLSSRVATVDSFQGREQEVIIFGFTRSNAEGRIGFLAELRRLNVSLTRARRQLILVGDSLTLTGTPDQAFARLAKALLQSAKSTPLGYFPSSELPRRLQP